MTKHHLTLVAAFLAAVLLLSVFSAAQEPPANETNQSNTSEQQNGTTQENTSEQSPPQNQTAPPEEKIIAISFIDFFPKKFDLGDVQLNVLIQNTGNVPLHDVSGIVTGDGISTYDVVPIDKLNPGEKNYILLFISTKKSGDIPIVFKILDKLYKTKLTINNPDAVVDTEKKQMEEEALHNRTVQLGDLMQNLTKTLDSVEEGYYVKKGQGYDIHTTPEDAKTYLRNAQASFAKRDLDNTEANLVLLQSELSDLQKSLDTAVKQKPSINDRLKDNVPWITALLTGVIAVITITERFKKKSDALKEKLHKVEAQLRKRKKKRKSS